MFQYLVKKMCLFLKERKKKKSLKSKYQENQEIKIWGLWSTERNLFHLENVYLCLKCVFLKVKCFPTPKNCSYQRQFTQRLFFCFISMPHISVPFMLCCHIYLCKNCQMKMVEFCNSSKLKQLLKSQDNEQSESINACLKWKAQCDTKRDYIYCYWNVQNYFFFVEQKKTVTPFSSCTGQ